VIGNEISRRVLFSNNVLTEVRQEDSGVRDSVVEGNLMPE
jgi:hypothetical protein